MKKTILIADDDGSVRRMVARVLESSGYAVILGNTGGDAAVESNGSRPDLVLLDLKLPDREGWESLERDLNLDAAVPVIVMTAWPNQSEQAARRGVDALMEKPLDLPLLLQTVADLLVESQQQRTKRLTERRFPFFKFAHA
jgi:DNA-binding response OmpR family regulator